MKLNLQAVKAYESNWVESNPEVINVGDSITYINNEGKEVTSKVTKLQISKGLKTNAETGEEFVGAAVCIFTQDKEVVFLNLRSKCIEEVSDNQELIKVCLVTITNTETSEQLLRATL